MRKVFLDDLPRWESGEGCGNIGTINWGKSIGYKIKFIYDDIDGYIEIIGYDKKSRKLHLKFNEEKSHINCSNFVEGKIGGVLIRYESYKTTNFEIYNIFKFNEKGIVWDDVKTGEILKTNHSRYGYNEFEFIRYDKTKRRLYLKCNNKDFNILIGSFCKGNIGELLNRYTKNYKFNIGDTFVDNKRDLDVIDREYRKKKHGTSMVDDKWYKYKCNKCGYEGWIVESHLINNRGCSCCNNKVVVKGINDLLTTAPWMIDLGVSKDDSERYTKSSGVVIEVKCPHCGTLKKAKISDIFTNKSIGCRVCGDSVSFPEKFINNMLKQLDIDFETQKVLFKNVSNRIRYDFYFKYNNKEYIIETHGIQHYDCGTGFDTYGGRTFKEESENDEYKKQLVIENGIINYIVLDCRYSELEWIKKSVLDSELNNIFDLSKINWQICERYAMSNTMKRVCDYWNNNKVWATTGDISKEFRVNYNTITRYLKKGKQLGWTDYNPKSEVNRIAKINGEKARERLSKPILIFKEGLFLGKFNSASELERQSENIFGVKLDHCLMGYVAQGRQKNHKGFTFKYVD